MNNETQTDVGSLVTDGYTSTPGSRNTAMGLVSDGGSDVTRPVTSWLFTIITAVGLITFLCISFYRYRKRLRDKRDREEEYIRLFKELLPDCDYNDFKVTRARSVMTNTHFNTYPNLDQMEFGVWPPIGRRLFRTVPGAQTNPQHQTTRAETHLHPLPDIGYLPQLTRTGSVTKLTGTGNIHDLLDIPYMDECVDGIDNNNTFDPDFTKLSTKCGAKLYNKSKAKGKNKRKKQRTFLKSLSKPKKEDSGDFIEITQISNYQSPYLSDFYPKSQKHDSISESPFREKRQIKSDSDLHAFASEEFTPHNSVTFLQNDYYMEAGIPKPVAPHRYSGKGRRSSVISSGKESVNSNSFYDRLVPRAKPAKEYEELVHRNNEGFVNSHARSLPCLDTEYHRNHQKDIFHRKETTAHAPLEPDVVCVNSESSPRRSSDPLLQPIDGVANINTDERGVTDGRETEMKTLLNTNMASKGHTDDFPTPKEAKKQTTKL